LSHGVILHVTRKKELGGVLVAIPTLLLISVIIFGVLALAPGDPLAQFALISSNVGIATSTRRMMY